MIVAPVAIIVITSGFLFVYGMNLLYLSWRALRLPRAAASPAPRVDEQTVLVQVPIYNERYVASRVVEACARLDWPRERLEIQVLDDSDDDTPEIVAQAITRWREAGININHVRRGSRSGYKAGALAYGLTLSSAPLVTIFDADFVPGPDFLRRMVPSLSSPRAGFAQARWGHLNHDFSLFTHLQGLMTDFHFLVEQTVRAERGYLMNFTGSAGIWRRAAIEDAGGWSSGTLTEDLDLSYRAQLRGWRAVYREDVVVPQELPVSVDAYRGQQSRWATGSFQCAAGLLKPVLGSRLRVSAKFQALMHLLGYVAPIAMLVQVACYPLLLALLPAGQHPPSTHVPLAASLLSLAPAAGMAVAERRQGREWWRQAWALLGWSVLGAGTSLIVAAALGRALRGGGEFKRTPKYRIEHLGQDWRSHAYFQRGYLMAGLELALGAAVAVLAWRAFAAGQPLLGVYAGLFAAGFLSLSLAGLLQGLRMIRYEGLALRARAWPARLMGPGMLAGAALILLLALRSPEPFEDGYQHWLVAANLAASGQLRDPLFQMQDTWLPAYHILSAGLLKIFGLWQMGLLRLVNAGFGLGTLALTYRLAESRRQGMVAVALLGLNPIFILTATSAVAEPLLTLLLLAAGAAAAKRKLTLAAILAGLAVLTGTKAWLALGCVVAVLLVEALQRRRASLIRRSLAWIAPALVLALALQVEFGFASHSVARAALEVSSAAVRGSVPGSPWLRLGEFLGYFTLASLPLVVLGAVALIRNGGIPSPYAGRARGRVTGGRNTFYLASILYLGLVSALVAAGTYSGSHRYYYLALPGLALLAAEAGARLRFPAVLLPVGGAAVVAAAFVPVLAGLAADNRGLQAAGVSARGVPGTLLTDSPAAAYWSHKPPNDILGSAALPADQASVLAWLRSHDVHGLVLEDIDYYRAAAALPELSQGQETAPYVFLGQQSAYNVVGGKPVHVYALDTLTQSVSPGVDLQLEQGSWPGQGKTAGLAKGPVLVAGGQPLNGDGLGFGVPLAQFGNAWWFAGSDSAVAVSADGKSWVRTYDLNREEVDDAGGRFQRFQPGPSHALIQVTYHPQASGALAIEVRPLRLGAGLRQLVIANEQGAGFSDLADGSGSHQTGSSVPIRSDWARLRSAGDGVEWEVPAPPPAASFIAAREQRPGIDFSGLELVFDSRFPGLDYTLSIRRAR
jgi:Glycosyltransferase like family 2